MIDKFEIGKIYKLNTVLGTNKKMLNPGAIITVVASDSRKVVNWNNQFISFTDIETKITFLYDNQILYCRDYGDRLLYYFNEVTT